MRPLPFVVTFAFAVVFAATQASAQRRVPDAGMWAAGASIGAAVPHDDSLQNGLEVAGALEGYVTPRVSVRVQVGGSWWDITGRGFTGTVKPLFFDGNIVYNWEGGVWHPYVTAGIGAYRYRTDLNPNLEGSDTKAGVNLGGGFEYFFTRDATFTGELLYHKVGAFASPVTTFDSGSFWSFAIGVKGYFGR
jgi:Outer membrane protein beta-barrel domain